jgi:NtrC-family two-component system response regulator AlgB
MRAALDAARRAAVSDATVLLRGENGTGKTVLARMIHQMSKRQQGPFVVVNCPSLPEDLLMSELFGHVQGAFTGALHNRSGRAEMAESGTLFLDEIGEIQPKLQSKLLRFLQERVFERVGDSRSLKADVRVLAATSRNLEAGVREGRFREDLLFRLNVVEILLPPVRERGEDILPLAQGFLTLFARLARRPALALSPAAERLLRGYAWPGNVRELRNAIERAVILWPGQTLEPAAFPERIGSRGGDGPRLGGWHTLEVIEREHIERVIEQIPNLEEAARILGIDDSTLWRKRKKFGKSESDRPKESP